MMLLLPARAPAAAHDANAPATAPKADATASLLKISDNRRFLVRADGTPFFYLGDTAWELFHRLNREDAELYLKDRAAKQFTVIQAVVLAEIGGLTVPNAYGHLPLHDKDPARPDEDYFKDVDWVVDEAASLGLFVGMLPTWGDKVNKKWGEGPEVFTPANAAVYGEFLGRRYRDKPIIWVLGGDRPAENENHLAVWRAMAAGLRKGDEGRHLITYHTMGERSSAEKLHDEAWLDFNTLQSGHGRRDIANYAMIAKDYARQPVKPCMDSEPRYEDHPINWKPANGWFDEYDVRKAAYWSLLAGACGHTYGCHDVWQFLQEGRQPVSSARTQWKAALDLSGAGQMRYARRLLESRPYLSRVPDESILKSDPGAGGDHAQAARDAAGSYAIVYIPSGKPATIDMSKVAGPVRAWWYDPRNGKAKPAGEFKNEGEREFIPPAAEAGAKGNDWVLLLDEASRNFGPPGEPAKN